jgi:hypothetical protein
MKPLVPISVSPGVTCVRVMKKFVNERTGSEQTAQLHEGIVLQDNGAFVRVFNPASRDKGGDASPEMSQRFPLLGPRVWCEKIKDLETAFPIPASFHA